MTEPQYADLLERATAELRPTRDLVAGGIAAGRRRRRNGLALTAAGALAAVAVSGTALAALQGDPAPRERTLVADPPSAVPAPTPTMTPVVPAGTMAATLTGLLDGTRDVTDPRNWGDSDFRAGSVLLDGAAVTVLVERTESYERCGEVPPIATCERYGAGWLSTGTIEEVRAGEGGTGVIGTTVTYHSPDQVAVVASALNASAEKDREPIMDRPVLGVPALTDIATAPVWLDVLG